MPQPCVTWLSASMAVGEQEGSLSVGHYPTWDHLCVDSSHATACASAREPDCCWCQAMCILSTLSACSQALTAQTFQILDEAAAVLSALHAQHVPATLLLAKDSMQLVKTCLEEANLLDCLFSAVVRQGGGDVRAVDKPASEAGGGSCSQAVWYCRVGQAGGYRTPAEQDSEAEGGSGSEAGWYGRVGQAEGRGQGW